MPTVDIRKPLYSDARCQPLVFEAYASFQIVLSQNQNKKSIHSKFSFGAF
jgi:hypothetical protein